MVWALALISAAAIAGYLYGRYPLKRIALLEAWMLELSTLKGENDPNEQGKMLCWCAPRNPFTRGAHDDSCLAARAYFAAPRAPSRTHSEPEEGKK